MDVLLLLVVVWGTFWCVKRESGAGMWSWLRVCMVMMVTDWLCGGEALEKSLVVG